MVVFLDTSFILAVRNKDDTNHARADVLMKLLLEGKHGRIVVLDHVFDETVTLALVRTRNKGIIADIGEFILSSPRIKLLFIGKDLFNVSWQNFLQYFDQGLSFTDSALLTIEKAMRGKAIVATFDRTLANLVRSLS